ncbi:DUF4269 domain-containing protein [Mucilaginibacter gynuensis]|uniref:DUF4269 domain-containing protein n=1 Tax=Mucilaginibacter gynuensis TaxID=1302236 RepID=A0ABP8GQS6_9SPHI
MPASVQHFDTIDYLKTGSPIQQQAWQVLTEYRILEQLASFSPILTGTIPIDIAVPGSDLDMVCCYNNINVFMDTLVAVFSMQEQFLIKQTIVKGIETVICNFFIRDFEVEVFGQSRPVKDQEAYRHMIVEYLLLQKHGEAFRRQVIDLKLQGIKTEPAFAQLLNLPGDPYVAMLNLYDEMIRT